MHLNLLKDDAPETIPVGEATHLDWPYPAAHAASEIADDDVLTDTGLEMLGRLMVGAVAVVAACGALLMWWLA